MSAYLPLGGYQHSSQVKQPGPEVCLLAATIQIHHHHPLPAALREAQSSS